MRTCLLKGNFQSLWGYVSPYWAGRFLPSFPRKRERWRTRTMRSRIEPMKKVVRMMRSHRALILNWFHAKGRWSSGAVEEFNGKARPTTRKAFGFRTCEALETALYHTLGNLPEPGLTHKFC